MCNQLNLYGWCVGIRPLWCFRVINDSALADSVAGLESNCSKITFFHSYNWLTWCVQTELFRVNHAGWNQFGENDCQIVLWPAIQPHWVPALLLLVASGQNMTQFFSGGSKIEFFCPKRCFHSEKGLGGAGRRVIFYKQDKKWLYTPFSPVIASTPSHLMSLLSAVRLA